MVVAPDRGGHRDNALGDAGTDPGGGASLVAFEVELAFEGLVDRFDDLTQRFEEPGACTGCFAFAGGPQQIDAVLGEGGLEGVSEVVLVGDQQAISI